MWRPRPGCRSAPRRARGCRDWAIRRRVRASRAPGARAWRRCSCAGRASTHKVGISVRSFKCQIVGGPSDPVGMEIEEVLLIRSVELRQTRGGSPFLRMTLGTRSSTLPAVLWDADERAVELAEHGAAVHVVGEGAEHPRYGRQLTVEAMRRADEAEIVWEELVDGPARPAAELEHDLDPLVGSIAEPHLRALLARLLDDRYREMPAAKFNHHAYRSGLL